MMGRSIQWVKCRDGTKVVALDPLLEPFAEALRYRYGRYWELLQSIDLLESGLRQFSRGYEWFGLRIVDGGVEYREWAPGAKEVYICGDFNGWNKTSHPLEREQYGYWRIFLPRLADGSVPIKHNSRIKALLITEGGMLLHRNPAASTYLLQDKSTNLFDTVFWDPPEDIRYSWKHPKWLPKPDSLRIYECHVGMATRDAKVGSYTEFIDNVLPRVKRLGYTAIQIMAIAEHAYYGSFGYHVTNPFAVSSRCGTPEDLKRLVDAAHGMGITVLMDIVHSHASSNSMDGINHFDGTDGQYFHEGEEGRHREWDSRLYNYGHWEVLRYLLSNLRWWMDEYHFDGFRFDGVSSMLYKHHGMNVSFTGDYAEYFGFHVDVDACVYIMLANQLIHELNPAAISIAEEVSGAPTICQPVADGGLGFDYRLGMGIPNMWIRLLLDRKDEDWRMGELVHELTNRRNDERIVAYAESHDQAIVGDKTIAHWLMGDDLFKMMGTNLSLTPKLHRGFALHKLIRLLTYTLGGEAYLNFMGNEFGHPEWIDFPRKENNFSHERARRRWDLGDDPHLRFKQLETWDELMHKCESQYRFCRPDAHRYILHVSESDKLIAFERGQKLLFVFNFHPTDSYTDFRIGVLWPGSYKVVLDSDGQNVGGQGRVHWHVTHETEPIPWAGRPNSLLLYIPARTCQVYHVFSDNELQESQLSAGLENLTVSKAPQCNRSQNTERGGGGGGAPHRSIEDQHAPQTTSTKSKATRMSTETPPTSSATFSCFPCPPQNVAQQKDEDAYNEISSLVERAIQSSRSDPQHMTSNDT